MQSLQASSAGDSRHHLPQNQTVAQGLVPGDPSCQPEGNGGIGSCQPDCPELIYGKSLPRPFCLGCAPSDHPMQPTSACIKIPGSTTIGATSRQTAYLVDFLVRSSTVLSLTRYSQRVTRRTPWKCHNSRSVSNLDARIVKLVLWSKDESAACIDEYFLCPYQEESGKVGIMNASKSAPVFSQIWRKTTKSDCIYR